MYKVEQIEKVVMVKRSTLTCDVCGTVEVDIWRNHSKCDLCKSDLCRKCAITAERTSRCPRCSDELIKLDQQLEDANKAYSMAYGALRRQYSKDLRELQNRHDVACKEIEDARATVIAAVREEMEKLIVAMGASHDE